MLRSVVDYRKGRRLFGAITRGSCLIGLALAGTACSNVGHTIGALGPVGESPLPQVERHQSSSLSSYISHVVIIIQENRSFDNLFAGYPGADAPTYGYLNNGTRVPLRPVNFNTADLYHGWHGALLDWNNGAMNGFNVAYPGYSQSATAPYAYVERSLIKPYWTMADHYVLADHMFPTEMGATYTAHFDLITGSSNLTPTQAIVNDPSAAPWGCDAPAGTYTYVLTKGNPYTSVGPFPCFTQFKTIGDLLDAGGVSWKYYAPSMSDVGGPYFDPYASISGIRYGPDWGTKVVSPPTSILTDIANGQLPSVSWVAPDWKDSDHSGDYSSTGPSWVSSIVNSIGQSAYWKSTAIIVLWDDWGGWYDNVAPPQLDFIGLGLRVPCLIISPYSKVHYVSHTQYEYGSTIKLIEQVFNLPSLGVTDARANTLLDSFDFTHPARTYETIPVPYSIKHFLREKPSHRMPDDE